MRITPVQKHWPRMGVCSFPLLLGTNIILLILVCRCYCCRSRHWRFPPPSLAGLLQAELETWDDAEPASAWDEEVLDDNEAEAISAEAKKQKREADRQRRQQEREQRRVQQEQKRQEQLQRKQLGMKIP